MAITSQPGVYPSIGEEGGMKMTQSYAGGLDQLNSLDRIMVQQKMELCEVLTGWEQKNKYQICDSVGQEIFFMREENIFLGRCSLSLVVHIGAAEDGAVRGVNRVGAEEQIS